jgi:hypothetical protein
MPQLALVIVVAVSMMLAACSSAPPTPSSVDSGTVSASEGGTFSADGATLIVPPGAVEGTARPHIHATALSTQLVTVTGAVVAQPVGHALEVDLSGQQPRVPLTLRVPVPGGHPSPGVTYAVITEHAGEQSVLKATPAAEGTVSVSVTHLSTFQLATLDLAPLTHLLSTGFAALIDAAGLHHEKPDCAGKPAPAPDGRSLNAVKASGPVWPCLEVDGHDVIVTVHDADVVPWQVRAASGRYLGAAEAESTAAVAQALYDRINADRPYADGLVLPGGEGRWAISLDSLPVTMQGQVSLGGWLATMSVFSTLWVAEVASAGRAGSAKDLADAFQRSTGNKAEAWDCMVKVLKAAPQVGPVTVQGIAAALSIAAGCATTVAEKGLGLHLFHLAKLVLALMQSGAAILAGAVAYAFRSLSGRAASTWQLVISDAAVTGPAPGRPAPAPARAPAPKTGPAPAPPTARTVSCGASIWREPDAPPCTDPGAQAVPADAQRLGGVDLDRYCSTWGLVAVNRWPNTWGWRCGHSRNGIGHVAGDQNISVDTACAQQYGAGALSSYRQYRDVNSWFCFR